MPRREGNADAARDGDEPLVHGFARFVLRGRSSTAADDFLEELRVKNGLLAYSLLADAESQATGEWSAWTLYVVVPAAADWQGRFLDRFQFLRLQPEILEIRAPPPTGGEDTQQAITGSVARTPTKRPTPSLRSTWRAESTW